MHTIEISKLFHRNVTSRVMVRDEICSSLQYPEFL